MKLVTIALFLSVTACVIHIGPTPAPSPCAIESLMLDESLFHDAIYQTGPPSKKGAPMRFGIDKRGVGFTSQTQGGAGQDVYEGRSARQTQEKFTEIVQFAFSRRKGYTDWYIPEGLHYQSAVADQMRFGCHRHEASGVEKCQVLSQYEVYLVRFHVDISSFLTHTDLERLLQTIDTKMAQCLAN